MSRKEFHVLAAALLLTSAAALPASSDSAPATSDWSGLYVGGTLGAGWAGTSMFFPFGAGGTAISIESSGVIGGVVAGYQRQWGSMVVGVEASFSAADLDGSGSIPAPAVSCRTGVVTCRLTDVESLTLAGLRVGYAKQDWLLFLSGGYAGADISTDGVVVATGVASYADSVWHDGWSIGAGAEYAIAPRWSLGLEYQHVDLGEQRHAQSFGAGNFRDVDLELDIVRARLTYSFGG